jgi:hypothetical protein
MIEAGTLNRLTAGTPKLESDLTAPQSKLFSVGET